MRGYVYLDDVLIGFEDFDGDGQGKKYYTVCDILGSVTEIYDADCRCVWKNGYTAFGIPGLSDGVLDGLGFEFGGTYTGKEYDGETGLTYYWNRWKCEDGSCFISEDPARDGCNWYGYAGGNPVGFVDPTGLIAKCAKQKYEHPAEEFQSSGSGSGLVFPSSVFETNGIYNARNILTAVNESLTIDEALPGMLKNVGEGFLDSINPLNILKGFADMGDPAKLIINSVLSYLSIKSILEEGTESEKIELKCYLLGSALGAFVAGEFVNCGGKVLKGVCKTGSVNKVNTSNSGTISTNVTKNINGVNVIQDNSLINPDIVDSRGRTNLERMNKGLAPIGPDGKSINLHHVDQTMEGPVKEMTSTYHQQNYGKLHNNTGQFPSQIDRKQYENWRNEYWKIRGEDF